jgi:hypothetical protein
VTVLQQQWSELSSGTSVPIGLAMAEHGLLRVLGIEPSIQRDSKTTIVFAGTDNGEDFGIFAHLHVERHGDGHSVFYPNPVTLGLMGAGRRLAARFRQRRSLRPASHQ